MHGHRCQGQRLHHGISFSRGTNRQVHGSIRQHKGDYYKLTRRQETANEHDLERLTTEVVLSADRIQDLCWQDEACSPPHSAFRKTIVRHIGTTEMSFTALTRTTSMSTVTITTPASTSTDLQPHQSSNTIPVGRQLQSSDRPNRHSILRADSVLGQTTSAPPCSPLPWMWQCHLCGRQYRLAATSRCLDDGHRFCAGTTVTMRIRPGKKKVIRHKACASEFDYAGWKQYGIWRREVIAEKKKLDCPTSAHKLLSDSEQVSNEEASDSTGTDSEAENDDLKRRHNCWIDCDFPSECRWGSQLALNITQGDNKF